MPKKILLVEDEETLLKTMNDALLPGYDVITSSDGNDAYNKAITQKPDLILLDMVLPGIVGLDLLKKLRKDAWGANVKVIVLTNLTDINLEIEAKGLGVLDYFVKSNTSIKEILKKISQNV